MVYSMGHHFLNKKVFSPCIFLTAWFCILGCTDTSPTQAGSATQTTNTITVSAIGRSFKGSAPVGTRLSAFSDSYLPHLDSGTTLSLTVGPDTLYDLGPLSPGGYTLLAQSAEGDSVQIFRNLAIGAKTPISQTDSLKTAENISGSVLYNGKPQASAWVFIQGSPFYAKSNEDGAFQLKGLPPGQYDIQAQYAMRSNKSPVVKDTVSNYPVGVFSKPALILNLK